MRESTKKLINWSELSNVLLENDKRKTPLRRGEIPIKYKNRVEKLDDYLNSWLKDIDLMEREEATKPLKGEFKEIMAKMDEFYKEL